MSGPVSCALSRGVATIVMDDGKVNAMSIPMLTEINIALDRAENDGAVVILTEKPGVFSAGFDLSVFACPRFPGDAGVHRRSEYTTRRYVKDPPWKRLVEELKDQGYESVYLDRLRATMDVDQQHGILEKEIIQEMAYALGRSAAKVDHALLELELLANEVQRAATPEQRASLRHAAERKRKEALELRRDLLIHREALGIRRNDILETMYPIADSPFH